MGSSCEANGSSIDSTVGGLVWVRRRNGSWWPGRILGSDELPESCLVSPRSGTPVKLLGREDASVDWYNLEKSKRVKAFRCGEYDECIEKAKVTAAISCKKAVKYARREDAILHALELESARLSKHSESDGKQPDEETEGTSDKLSSLECISNSCRTSVSEDDGMEGSKKRMRGLEDLGIGGTLSVKRRRSQAAHVHEFLKKKNRRRQLTKVLESTAMVTVPVLSEQITGLTGSFLLNQTTRQIENEISSITELPEDDSSVRLFDVPLIGEEKQPAGFFPVSEKPQSGQSSLVEQDEIQESGSVSSGGGGISDISHAMDNNGTSKWQHKGKRNSRNKSKTVQKFFEANVLANEAKSEPRLLPYRQSRFMVNPNYESSDVDMESLFDVNVEVKAGHFPHHVPYISLMSKLTGQPITGHPLVVEVLNDAVSDLSLNSSECHSSSCELTGVNGDVGMVQETVGSPGKSPKKARRNGVLCNKKIRSLSSLTSSKRLGEEGKFKKPGLACIPLKVVFGRINAALGIKSAEAG